MDLGDVVLACHNMKRYIIVSKAPGSLIDSSLVVLVCIRYGDVITHYTSELLLVKPCGYVEFVQAIENLKPCDRHLLDFLKPVFSDYKCTKCDQGSVFIK